MQDGTAQAEAFRHSAFDRDLPVLLRTLCEGVAIGNASACVCGNPEDIRNRGQLLANLRRALAVSEDIAGAINCGPQQLMAPVLPMVPRHPVEALPDSLRDPRVAR